MISIKNYSKKIKGNIVLDNININFEDGKIYGLLGRNGSGKTMLLRAIAGLIYPTSGEILIDGQVLHKDISFPPSVGVIIEHTDLLPYYNAFTNLKILAKIKNQITDENILESIKKVGLNPLDKRKVKTYSLGMKQKLSIAQALMESPRILLLDEPTNALDLESVELVRNLLIKEKQNGTTIIIASHNKEDLEFLSDQIVHVENGSIKY